MDVLIEFEGKEEKVVLRRLKWGEVRDSLRKSIVGDKVDLVLREDLQIVDSIVEAPFPKTLEALHDLDFVVGERLKKAFNELNKVGEKQKKN